MSMVNGYQPGTGAYYPQTGYPGYPTTPGYYPQPGYGNDAYSQGYQQGMNGAAGTANQVAGWGNTMAMGSANIFGTLNSVVGTAANLLGGVTNMVTGLFGGLGGQTTQSYYGQYYQPQYPQQNGYQPQPGQQYGPAWGQDMAQAQQQVWSQVSTMARGSQVDNLIDQYADQAETARKAMQTSVDNANNAIKDLQAAIGRLQAQGGPNSPQGQAILTEIASLKDRAMSSLTEIDNQSRKVYIAAFEGQMAYQWGAQRFGGSINQSACARNLGKAWSFYNGAPTERLHWYSLTKSNIPNAVSLQANSRQQVTAILTQLDNMLKQSVGQSMAPTAAPTTASH